MKKRKKARSPAQRAATKRMLAANKASKRAGGKKQHRKKHRKARSPAQRAATKRMLAANKRAGGHTKKHRRRKSKSARRARVGVNAPSRASGNAPSKRLKRRRARNNVKGYFPNPAPKGASMAKRHHRRRRSNPISIKGALARPMAVLRPALAGAAGALAINGVINYVPGIPDSLKTGNMLYLTKAILALALGTFGPKIPGIGKHARDMAQGALTVTAADLGKQLAMEHGSFNLSGVGFVSPASIATNQGARRLAGPGVSQYVSRGGMSLYVNGMRGR